MLKFNQIDTAKILSRLGMSSIADLNQALVQSIEIRKQQACSRAYMIQTSTLENSLSYVFTPFISAVLNRETVYIAPRKNIVEQVFQHYFRLEALELEWQQSLNEMKIQLDLVPAHFSADEFRFYALLKALLDPLCRYIDVIGNSGMESQQRAEFQTLFGIELNETEIEQQVMDIDQMDLSKLLWKRKNSAAADVCKHISGRNALIISRQFGMKTEDAERLVDDLMYSEHLFEKFSVFAEFTETIYKQHHEMKKVC